MTIRGLWFVGVGLWMGGLNAAGAGAMEGLQLDVTAPIAPHALWEARLAHAPNVLQRAMFTPEAQNYFMEVLRSDDPRVVINGFAESFLLWWIFYASLDSIGALAARGFPEVLRATKARHIVYNLFAAKLDTMDPGIGQRLFNCRREHCERAMQIMHAARPMERFTFFFRNLWDATEAMLLASPVLSAAIRPVHAADQSPTASDLSSPHHGFLSPLCSPVSGWGAAQTPEHARVES